MGRFAFLLAAGISSVGAVIHFAVPWLGPEWHAGMMSVRAGMWFAPAGAASVGVVMLIFSLYALAGTGRLRWLPFAQMMQGGIAAVCLLRGLLVLPYLYKFPDRFWTFAVMSSLIWLAAGLAFLVGILKSASVAEPSDAQASGV